jgi:hypothetical protein
MAVPEANVFFSSKQTERGIQKGRKLRFSCRPNHDIMSAGKGRFLSAWV